MKNYSPEATDRKRDGKSEKKGAEDPQRNPRTLKVEKRPEQTDAEAMAEIVISGGFDGITVVYGYAGDGKLDVTLLDVALQKTINRVKSGDLSDMEAMLVGQATALQSIFSNLATRALNQKLMPHYQTHLALALKAQAQSRATISALVELKFPKQVAFVKQANIANGPQQVNNGDVPEHNRAEESKPLKNKLSPQIEDTLHERETLDFGTTAAAGRTNPAMVPVGKINRTKDRSR
jgi:hypothetical protein